MEEVWKNIEGYKDYYVSNMGRVKSTKNGNKKIIKQKADSLGKYLLVSLCKDGFVKSCLVHRLVAKAFLKNKNKFPQVNHKDLNKKNNRVDNLEWVTASENSKHAYKNGVINIPTYKGRFGKQHNKSIAVIMKKPDGEKEIYYSYSEFKRKTGGDHTSICWAKNHNQLPYLFHRGFLKGWTLVDFFKPYKSKLDD
jgi:hypothetical protein